MLPRCDNSTHKKPQQRYKTLPCTSKKPGNSEQTAKSYNKSITKKINTHISGYKIYSTNSFSLWAKSLKPKQRVPLQTRFRSLPDLGMRLAKLFAYGHLSSTGSLYPL